MTQISYKSGYKYVLHDTYIVDTGILGVSATLKQHISLTAGGVLTISAGYAFDGASGPAMDTPSIMRGSLVHDALYQLMAEDALPFSFRKRADELLIQMCKEDGMYWIRRQWVKAAVRVFGAMALENTNPVRTAP